MGIRTWNLCLVTPKCLDYMQCNMILQHAIEPERCVHIMVKVLATITRFPEDQIHAILVTWSEFFFRLYLKLFLPSIFKCVDFWSSVSCNFVDFELADNNVSEELGIFIDGNVQGYSVRPPKRYKPTKQTFFCTRKFHRIVWNSRSLDYSELANILPKDVKAECFAKGTEKCKIIGILLNKEVESFDDHGCPKTRDLVDHKADEQMWICSSYPFRHKATVHCAECKSKLLANWSMQHLKL